MAYMCILCYLMYGVTCLGLERVHAEKDEQSWNHVALSSFGLVENDEVTLKMMLEISE